jgi:hypothetical protein
LNAIISIEYPARHDQTIIAQNSHPALLLLLLFDQFLRHVIWSFWELTKIDQLLCEMSMRLLSSHKI